MHAATSNRILPVEFRVLQHISHRVHTDLFVPGCQRSRFFASAGSGRRKWGRLCSLTCATSPATGEGSAGTAWGGALSSRAGHSWWNRWRLSSAAVQRCLLSAGAHDILQVLVVDRQQRLQLPAENGFEITGRMFCAEAMFEGYMKRPSSLERLLLVHLIIGIRQR
jgi:hypothetical protein